MLNAPSLPSSHSPLAAANRHSLDGVARLHVNEHKRARAAGGGVNKSRKCADIRYVPQPCRIKRVRGWASRASNAGIRTGYINIRIIYAAKQILKRAFMSAGDGSSLGQRRAGGDTPPSMT